MVEELTLTEHKIVATLELKWVIANAIWLNPSEHFSFIFAIKIFGNLQPLKKHLDWTHQKK